MAVRVTRDGVTVQRIRGQQEVGGKTYLIRASTVASAGELFSEDDLPEAVVKLARKKERGLEIVSDDLLDATGTGTSVQQGGSPGVPGTVGNPGGKEPDPENPTAGAGRKDGGTAPSPSATPGSPSPVPGAGTQGDDSGGGNGQEPEAVDYSDSSKFKVEDLEKLVEERNTDREDADKIQVTGTGSNGNIVRSDLEKALQEDDAKQQS